MIDVFSLIIACKIPAEKIFWSHSQKDSNDHLVNALLRFQFRPFQPKHGRVAAAEDNFPST